MEKKLELLNDIFEADLTQDDLDMEVKTVFKWDSFHIMDFLVETEERFHRRITIEEISRVSCVRDLIRLMERK